MGVLAILMKRSQLIPTYITKIHLNIAIDTVEIKLAFKEYFLLT